jgi:subtilisin family serine protease
MTITKQRAAWLTAVLVAVLGVLALAVPVDGASSISRSPKPRGRHMHWYHWHPSARALKARTARFGSTAVVGLESMDDLAAFRAAYRFERVRAIPALRAVEVSVDGAELQALLAQALTDPRVRYVSPVGPRRRPLSMPNDPLLSTVDAQTGLPYEWQFAVSRVDRALDLSPGDSKIVVGVIDTGAAAVPDLAGKVDGLWTLAPDGTPVSESVQDGDDDVGHGTAVASLIAANVDDGFGMAGFGGATHVIAFRADRQGFFDDMGIATALMKLDSLGVRIVNLSLGGPAPSEPILVDAIHKAAADGLLLVAAVGNAHEHVAWPAADLQPSGGGRSFGLAVGATDVEGRLAGFSNSGKQLSLVAPGNLGGTCSGVLVALPPASRFDESCYPNWVGAGHGHYAYVAGTSFSAPEVAGVAALVWAARPELQNFQVADIIKQSARRGAGTGWTPTMGCGVLDAGAALELATTYAPEAAAAGSSAGPCSTAADQAPAWPTEADQTITFGKLANKTLGDPDFVVRATASSGLPVSFAASGACVVRGARVHLTAPGVCTITASQAGDANFKLAPETLQSFSIAEAEHVVPRRVRALQALGRWGAPASLRFAPGERRTGVTAEVTVQRNGMVLAQLAREFPRVAPGHVYSLAWRTPSEKTTAVFRFCVTLSDRAGKASAPSCGRIELR